MAKSFVEVMPGPGRHDRVASVNVQNSFNFLGVFFFIENHLNNRNASGILVQLGEELLGPDSERVECRDVIRTSMEPPFRVLHDSFGIEKS